MGLSYIVIKQDYQHLDLYQREAAKYHLADMGGAMVHPNSTKKKWQNKFPLSGGGGLVTTAPTTMTATTVVYFFKSVPPLAKKALNFGPFWAS